MALLPSSLVATLYLCALLAAATRQGTSAASADCAAIGPSTDHVAAGRRARPHPRAACSPNTDHVEFAEEFALLQNAAAHFLDESLELSAPQVSAPQVAAHAQHGGAETLAFDVSVLSTQTETEYAEAWDGISSFVASTSMWIASHPTLLLVIPILLVLALAVLVPVTAPCKEEQVESQRRAVLFACFLCLAVVGEGYDIGVLNGAAVRVKEAFSASTLEISLIVSITPTCVMPGAILGGALADYVGRWRAALTACVVLTVGPVAMALSQSIPMLICMRGIVGLGIGMAITVVNLYISEVAPTAIRGRLTALTGVFLNVGILAGYFANWCLHGIEDDWRWMFAIGAVLPFIVVFLLFLPQMAESPRWLFAQGREDEAEEALAHYIGAAQAADDIAAMRKQAKQGTAETEEIFVTWGELLRAFGAPGAVRRMLLTSVLVAGSQLLCGYLAIAYYSSTLLKGSAGERTAFLVTIAMGVVKLTVGIVTVLVLDRFGRRPMLLASSSITALACIWLAMTFRLQAHWAWQAVGFMLFMAGFEMGLGPVAIVYIAEVCSTAWRAKSMSFAICMSRVVGSLHLFGFPLAVDELGKSTTLAFQALVGVAITCAMCVFVTETNGRSLECTGSRLFAD